MDKIVQMHIWFMGADKKTTYKIHSDGDNTVYDIVRDGLEEGWLKFADVNDDNVIINMDDVSQIKFEDECEEEEEEDEE